MISQQRQPYYTLEQYLQLEDEALEKHEYHAGRIYAMSGASPNHNRIAGNVYASLHQQLRGRPCEAFGSEVKIRVSETGLHTYPDVSALCGEARFDTRGSAILLNPTALVEVLSPSTESYDRGGKFAQYRTMASLREYLLVAQDRALVERFTRSDDPEMPWGLVEAVGLEATMALPSVGCALRLSDVYDRVELPPRPPLRAVYEPEPPYAVAPA